MRLIKNFLTAALVFSVCSAGAQTADEIVAKNIDAMGGTSKLSTLNSVKLTGSMNAQGNDIPLTITKLNAKGMRLDIDIMGTSNYQIITPDKGYMFFPIQGMTEAKELDADMVKSAQSQLDLQGSLFNYKEKGSTVEYIGTEKADGKDVYHLKLTDKNGKILNYFIDTKTNRLAKSTGKSKGPDGQEMDIETTYTDWKQNNDGYWFPYSMTAMQGPITYDKIETNIKVDESIFKN